MKKENRGPKLLVTEEDCKYFIGGWEYPLRFILNALNSVTFQDKLRTLEFGAGAGSDKIAKLLTSQAVPFQFRTYENDPKWAPSNPDIEVVMWSRFPTSLKSGTFDLVLIDGPNGVVRKDWYPLIKPLVREGTILAIDDFGHYQEFRDALDANFIYEELYSHRPEARSKETWLIVKVLGTLPS